MLDQTYETPEGFKLHRPLLLPDARSFSDVLEYVREWDYEIMSSSGRHYRPELVPAPRYAPGVAVKSWRGDARMVRNEIGPFCTVDLSQLDGPRHRSIAVRATDAVMDAVRDRIVTDDDHLSFQLIGHESSGRVLVILKHGQIIGSHYVAYVDPTTVPAYPLQARDDAEARMRAEMEAEGFDAFHGSTGEPYEVTLRRFKRTTGQMQNIYSGSTVVVRADGTVA